MVTDNLTPRRPWGTYALALLWATIGVSALLMLAKSVQNSSDFGRLQPWILLLNAIGVIGLTVLIARKIWQLVSDYRANVPGSRLTARTVATFGALVVAPLLTEGQLPLLPVASVNPLVTEGLLPELSDGMAWASASCGELVMVESAGKSRCCWS